MAFQVPAEERGWFLGSLSRWGAAAVFEVARKYTTETIYGQPGGGTGQHLRGDAADFMVTNLSKSLRPTALANMREWVRAGADRLSVEQVIAGAMIWTHTRDAEGWRPYVPPGFKGNTDELDDSTMHRNHMHLTFRTQAPDPEQRDLRVYTPPVYPFPASSKVDPWAPPSTWTTAVGWMLLAAGADPDYKPGPRWSQADTLRLDAFRRVNGIPVGGTPGPSSFNLLMSGKGKAIGKVGS